MRTRGSGQRHELTLPPARIQLGPGAYVVHGVGPKGDNVEETFVVLGVSPEPENDRVFRFLIHLHDPEVVQAALALQRAEDSGKRVAEAKGALKTVIESRTWWPVWVWKTIASGTRLQFVKARPSDCQPQALLTAAVFDLGSDSDEAKVDLTSAAKPTYFISWPREVKVDGGTRRRVAVVATTDTSHTLLIPHVMPVCTNGSVPVHSNIYLGSAKEVIPVATEAASVEKAGAPVAADAKPPKRKGKRSSKVATA